MRLTIVRHTEVDVPPGTCYGRTDVALKPSFPQEAAIVKANLQALDHDSGNPASTSYDGIYSSPLSRCRLLAEFCGYKDAESDEALLELDFGKWEMKPFDEIDDPGIRTWYDDWFHTPPTDGESMEQQVKRVRNFLLRKSAEGKQDILIFTHAGVILSILLIAGKAQLPTLFDHRPPYGGILRLILPDL